MPKKRRKLRKKAVPYLYFGAISKTAFYYIFLGWWTFLGILAVFSYLIHGSLPLDEIELASHIADTSSIQLLEEMRELELKIAVLEQELRNAGIILETENVDKFIKQRKQEQLGTFVSVSIFVSIIILRVYLNY